MKLHANALQLEGQSEDGQNSHRTRWPCGDRRMMNPPVPHRRKAGPARSRLDFSHHSQRLRRLHLTGPENAETLEMGTSSVSAVLKRIGFGKFSSIEQAQPIGRHEKAQPGGLIHIESGSSDGPAPTATDIG
jgi:hypothetical protein